MPLLISIDDDMTVDDLLEAVCSRRQLNTVDYFIEFDNGTDQKTKPDGRLLISSLVSLLPGFQCF
jgi:hypothetical protein